MTAPRLLALALLLALPACDGCRGDEKTDGARPSSAPAASAPLPLNPSDVVRIAEQRKIVRTTLRAHVGTTLEGTAADLPNLQKLVDGDVFSKDELYERQSIAIAFGDAIAKDLSLRWVMILHDTGTEPALCCRPDGTAIDVQALLVDPLERGEKVDLAAVRAAIEAQVRPPAAE